MQSQLTGLSGSCLSNISKRIAAAPFNKGRRYIIVYTDPSFIEKPDFNDTMYNLTNVICHLIKKKNQFILCRIPGFQWVKMKDHWWASLHIYIIFKYVYPIKEIFKVKYKYCQFLFPSSKQNKRNPLFIWYLIYMLVVRYIASSNTNIS